MIQINKFLSVIKKQKHEMFSHFKLVMLLLTKRTLLVVPEWKAKTHNKVKK